MVHVLNNVTTEYDFQFVLLEKKTEDKDKPLTVGEIRSELSLYFERLNMKSMKNDENEEVEEHA
jgi:hypothetical protein